MRCGSLFGIHAIATLIRPECHVAATDATGPSLLLILLVTECGIEPFGDLRFC